MYIAIHVDSFHVPAFWSAFSTSVKSTPPPVVESGSARPVPAPGAASQITVPVTASSPQLWSVTALSVSATSAGALERRRVERLGDRRERAPAARRRRAVGVGVVVGLGGSQ